MYTTFFSIGFSSVPDPRCSLTYFSPTSHSRVLDNAGFASDLCLDGAGNEASFVGLVVDRPVFGVGWLLASNESDFWTQDHFGHGHLVIGILRHDASGLVVIPVHDKPA